MLWTSAAALTGFLVQLPEGGLPGTTHAHAHSLSTAMAAATAMQAWLVRTMVGSVATAANAVVTSTIATANAQRLDRARMCQRRAEAESARTACSMFLNDSHTPENRRYNAPPQRRRKRGDESLVALSHEMYGGNGGRRCIPLASVTSYRYPEAVAKASLAASTEMPTYRSRSQRCVD